MWTSGYATSFFPRPLRPCRTWRRVGRVKGLSRSDAVGALKRSGGAERSEALAEQLAGFAEEVQKLASTLTRGRALTAAVQRDLLALRLAPILAIHLRLLYGSENDLWEQVGAQMDEEWRRAQAVAFSTGSEQFEVSCAAALHLFRLAANSVGSLFDDRQRAVVHHALAAAAPYARQWSQ